MNEIIEFMREHFNGYNGQSREIGWYMFGIGKVKKNEL